MASQEEEADEEEVTDAATRTCRSSSTSSSASSSPPRRRAEVRVGQLLQLSLASPAAAGDFDAAAAATNDAADATAAATGADSNSPGASYRRQLGQRRWPLELQPPRRPRAVPVRRLTARRPAAACGVCGGGGGFVVGPLTTPAADAGGIVDSADATVRLDLTGVRGIRAEVAFRAAAPPTAADADAIVGGEASDKVARDCPVLRRAAPTYAGGGFSGRFVQVRNPLCVPRCSDHLGTWRTCMVPIADLEGFAFMKPPRQNWRHLAQPCATATAAGADRAAALQVFTLMCYNILSDQYASAKSYWYCPGWALAWPYRRQGILETIAKFMPTVLCLQEVETEQFYSFFQPSLAKLGYEGIFSPKSRAKTMDCRLRLRVDGCAIFWKRSEFCLVEQQVIELNQQYLERCWTPHAAAAGAASSEIFSRVTPRDNIALAAVLAPAAPAAAAAASSAGHRRRRLLVCNSHVHWDPQHPDVKLIQTLLLAGSLAAIVGRHEAPLPLLLCGDFNSLPRSGVIEFLTNGSVPRDHPDFRRLGEDASLDGLQAAAAAAVAAAAAAAAAVAEAATAATEATAAAATTDGNGSPAAVGSASLDRRSHRFSHQLGLQSCYSGVDTVFTNYTHDFKGTIDYIFAARDHFRVLDCLDGLADWLHSEAVIGCPNAYIPSDHIPLMVRLQLLP